MSDEEREEHDAEVLPAPRQTFVTGRTYCTSCNHVLKPYYARCPKCEGDRNREKVDALAAVIRELKGSVDMPLAPDHEARLVKRLVELDHPDVRGFLTWLQDARENPHKHKRQGRR
jgi:uncharacterized OB-fold protein